MHYITRVSDNDKEYKDIITGDIRTLVADGFDVLPREFGHGGERSVDGVVQISHQELDASGNHVVEEIQLNAHVDPL